MAINVIKDKDLIYDIMDYDVILVGTGIKNTMGNGFQHKIAVSFRDVYVSNLKTKYDDIHKLGTVNVINLKPIIALCYITKGLYTKKNPDKVDYDALKSCLELINNNFKDKRIASTILGVSPFEGNGDKERILKMFNDICKDIDITLYDYEQMDYRIEDNIEYKNILEDKKENRITTEEYYERKKKYIWKRKFGYYKEMPKDVSYRKLSSIINDYNWRNNYDI